MGRTLVMSAVLIVGAGVSQAQITTYVAPPRPAAPSAQAVATADSVRRDSVAQVTMTNMKAWVDSAAGVPAPRVAEVTRPVVNDKLRASVVGDTSRTTVTTFSNGSVAPATASELPLLGILGFALLAVGALLLANRPRS